MDIAQKLKQTIANAELTTGLLATDHLCILISALRDIIVQARDAT
jgi:hypothetical protein